MKCPTGIEPADIKLSSIELSIKHRTFCHRTNDHTPCTNTTTMKLICSNVLGVTIEPCRAFHI